MVNKRFVILSSIIANNLYVITGPEGAGKTTLIEELKKRGMHVISESTRDVWRYQNRIDGRNIAFLSDNDVEKTTYFEMSLALDMRMYDDCANMDEIYVLDRAMPDLAIFMEFLNTPMIKHIDRAIRMHRYNPLVFLAPFWREIYTYDSERFSSLEQAESQEKICYDTYIKYGYNPIILPKVSVRERADFVMKYIFSDQVARMISIN